MVRIGAVSSVSPVHKPYPGELHCYKSNRRGITIDTAVAQNPKTCMERSRYRNSIVFDLRVAESPLRSDMSVAASGKFTGNFMHPTGTLWIIIHF